MRPKFNEFAPILTGILIEGRANRLNVFIRSNRITNIVQNIYENANKIEYVLIKM